MVYMTVRVYQRRDDVAILWASSITQPESGLLLVWLWCCTAQGNSTNEIHGYKNMHMRTRASVTGVQLKEGSTTPLVLMTSEPWSDRSEFDQLCFRLLLPESGDRTRP